MLDLFLGKAYFVVEKPGAQGDAGALEKISPIWNSHIQSVVGKLGSIFLCQDFIRICKLLEVEG